MNVTDLLPKDKFDDTNLKKIDLLSDEDFSIITYNMLEWIKDYNWPIADDVVKILLKRENLVFPFVLNILENSSDIMWKYWILNLLAPNFTEFHKMELKPLILKLVNTKIYNEDTKVLYTVALDYYNKYYQ